MKFTRAATIWIFECLGLDSELAGDLLEECERGRSAFWCWRQIVIAVWTGVWRAILGNKLLALRAVVVGCAVNAVWLILWEKFLPIGLSRSPSFSLESNMSLAVILLSQMATGWIIARTHREHAVPMVVVFAIWLTTWFFVDSRSPARRLLVNSIGQPRFWAYLAWYLTPISLVVLGLLIGVVACVRPKRQASRG